MFRAKAAEAVDKLFKPYVGDLKKAKRNVVAVLKECDFQTVVKRLGEVSQATLRLKFLLKDHKAGFPLRVVVNENGSWQRVLSVFIQKCLTGVEVDSPLSLRNSEQLIEILNPHHRRSCEVITLDIKDLYYSMNKSELLRRVRGWCDDHLVKFQSSSGIDVDSFMSILEFYLGSTVIDFEGALFIQKEGVCIGSSIAPVLSEIFLNEMDVYVDAFVRSLPSGAVVVRRYVDDILICSFEEGLAGTVKKCIIEKCHDLTFTEGSTLQGKIQYLDLLLHTQKGLCWRFGKESAKPLLAADSCHSKLVKRGVIASVVDNACKKSCVHHVGEAIGLQKLRLVEAGHHQDVISSVMLKVLRKFSSAPVEKPVVKNVVCVPYYHGISHNLKSVAKRFGVNLVFKAQHKLESLTPFSGGRQGCLKKHQNPDLTCQVGVVYDIPLRCGLSYVGQTGRCLNDRLLEHKRAVKDNAQNSEIAKHVVDCNHCQPEWGDTQVLHKEKENGRRVVRETLCILERGNCVSTPSLGFGSELKRFLCL